MLVHVCLLMCLSTIVLLLIDGFELSYLFIRITVWIYCIHAKPAVPLIEYLNTNYLFPQLDFQMEA